ncbi:conserved hypothetical protein [Leishmania major strain Friedlin]|uniref:Uncharacterized protein n=1 Tax=Leishmania major TaxID=5664 RepID=Q4QAL5_LEIMA|nr:conserved hypothetical protein [Leishmania major strain Friedlin]CAJ04851.1 conserved hypothetical protein [Leishmania major strain Friedlin]|eukprot:XP_001683633.1 conserved hypothetical protein [Leishmania major strain Friedlin]
MHPQLPSRALFLCQPLLRCTACALRGWFADAHTYKGTLIIAPQPLLLPTDRPTPFSIPVSPPPTTLSTVLLSYMARVYLLDVSYLAPFEACLPRGLSEPPLSWRCAAELAQWTSVAAVVAAWVAACAEATAATTATGVSAHETPVTSDVASCKPGREGYMRLGDDDDCDQAEAAASSTVIPIEVGAPSHRMYVIHTFPSAVLIHSKYFSTTLTLVTGAPLRPHSCYGHDRASPSDQYDITADLLRKCASSQSGSGASVSHVDDGGSYGGVLLAHITQDPAGVPWHTFPLSGCLFHAIMVFHNSETDVDMGEVAAAAPESLAATKARQSRQDAEVLCRPLKDATMPTDDTLDDAPTSLLQLKERWKCFAAENGYECIFHATGCPPRAATHTEASMESGGRALGGSAEDVQLECVSADSGRRGLLEAPLAGSNRLYQILCNTLWPAGVRRAADVATAARSDGHGEQENNAVTQAPTPLTPHSGNGFVVVGNDEDAMWRLFQQQEDGCAHVLRRRFRFFTSVVSLPADPAAPTEGPRTAEGNLGAAAARRTRVALVNRYYAAVVQPRLVQTAFFDARMQELLDRYWEQHMTGEGGSGDLCPDAPAVVLWPPSSSASCAARAESETRGAAAIPADADGDDVRASYPPLEIVLGSLARRGCRDVVVVVNKRRGGAVPSGLTEYEEQLCRERNVEVVQPEPARFNAASVGAMGTSVADLPMPVIRDEDDTQATRGVGRLHELLHCVQWGQTHLVKCAASPRMCLADRGSNSCLLLACGQTPFEEEAWVRDVLAALNAAPSSTRSKSATVSAEDYLRLAAPTIAAALGAEHGDDSADLGEHPAGAAIGVDVSTSYFNARVEVQVEGGLHSYYAASPTQRSGTRTMQPGWENAHDAYVVVTTLCALQEAARAIAGPARRTTADNPSSREAVSGSHGTLGTVISTLARQQREIWMAEQINAYVARQTSQKASDVAADSPLVLLYITDVPAADATRAEVVEQLVCALARPTAAPAAASLGENGSDSAEDADGYVPIELVFASERAGMITGAATMGHCDSLVLDGTARVREAFEQHLWPHRQSLSHHHRRVRNIPPTTHAREEAASPQGSTEATSAATADFFANEVTCASPLPVEAAAVSATTRASAAVARETVTADASWVAPVIGCALPNGYLVDPETLRSVPVRVVRGAPWNTAKIAGVEGRQGRGEASAQHHERLPQTHNDEELMQWMEKMKRYGHRLGEALRKEQAEVLALALEKML